MNLPLRHEHEHHVEELVAAACTLVGSGMGVRSVRVVTNDRPTYDELRCYHEWAQARHARLSVDGDGVITVRPDAASVE